MHDVAVAAGVSDSRVFSLFKDKPSLLWAVGDGVIAGSEYGVPFEQTKLATGLRREPDPRRRLTLVMAWARETYDPLTPVVRELAKRKIPEGGALQ